MRGVPLDATHYFAGTFGFLLNPYASGVGLLAVLALALHGAAWVAWRVSGEPAVRALRAVRVLWPPVVPFLQSAWGTGLHRFPRRSSDFGAAIPVAVGDAEDGRAEHLADGLEANAADRGELARGQRGPPRPAGPHSRHPGRSRGRQFFAHHSVLPRGSSPGRQLSFDGPKLLENIMEKYPSSFD